MLRYRSRAVPAGLAACAGFLCLAVTGLAAQAPTIPAGTSVSVRTVEAISSKGADPGQSYRCTVDSPILVDGQQIVARGADCVLRIIETREAGRLSGNAELKLELASVRVDKDLVDVASDAAAVQGAGKGKSTAVKTGVGSVAGAALGGLFGHGKGAAIGAGAGAGVGVATAAMTHGPQIKVAPETVLTFVIH